MKNKKWLYWLRWIAVLPVAFLSIILAIFIVIPIHRIVQAILWSMKRFMPGSNFITLMLPYDGAIAAVLFICLGVWIAPNYKSVVAIILFLIGAWCTYYLFGESYLTRFPKPQIDWRPIIATYVTGLGTVAIIVLRNSKKKHLKLDYLT